jgi:FtsH-binding integral membrane protein
MGSKSNGYINIPQINDSFVQLLKNIPTALCNSLFRPYFNDPGGWLKYPASIEVYLVFMFLLLAIIRHRKIETIDWGLILSLLLFVLTLSLTIGLVTPVLGAISRYRIPAYIALVFVGMLIYEHKKMTHE